MDFVEAASSPEDLGRGGYRVHRLSGDRRGFSTVPVASKLRVVFRIVDGNAYDLEVVDYQRG